MASSGIPSKTSGNTFSPSRCCRKLVVPHMPFEPCGQLCSGQTMFLLRSNGSHKERMSDLTRTPKYGIWDGKANWGHCPIFGINRNFQATVQHTPTGGNSVISATAWSSAGEECLTQQEARTSNVVVKGIINLMGHIARVLFDPSVTYSFVFSAFASKLNMKPKSLKFNL